MILLIFKGCIKFKREYYIALAGPPVALLMDILSTTGRERNPGKGFSLRLLLTCKPGSPESHPDTSMQRWRRQHPTTPQAELNSLGAVTSRPLTEGWKSHWAEEKRSVKSNT